jgi:hypothetical protein
MVRGVPNRMTRVPERDVPALPRAGRLALPVADAFMLAMLSRPGSGSLRTTWVTPATLWLCAATLAVGLPLGILAVIGHGTVLRVLAGAVLLLVALGALAVLLVGALQRSAKVV